MFVEFMKAPSVAYRQSRALWDHLYKKKVTQLPFRKRFLKCL